MILLVCVAWSEKAIYVSRLAGNDSTNCGAHLSPCRTISQGVHQASDGACIYLDGTATSKDPYTCQSLDEEHRGIYLTKGVSFVGIRSRAYISCLHGNRWLVDGSKNKTGIRVSFYALTFRNTTFRFFDAIVNITECLFVETKGVTLAFGVFNLAEYYLSFTSVAFEKNAMCIFLESSATNTRNISVYMTNSTFTRNGDEGIPSTILWLTTKRDNIKIELRNCSFKENTFGDYGMINVVNKEGTTSVSLDHFKLEKNGHTRTICNTTNGIFIIQSAEVILSLRFGFVRTTFGTFFTVIGQSARIDVSNTSVDSFYSPDVGGGVFNIFENVSSFVTIEDSIFRDGRSIWSGAVASIIAPEIILVIQNSTIHNISSVKFGGGAVCLLSHGLSASPAGGQNYVVKLNITGSSFSESTAYLGGAILAFAKNLFATVHDSSFVRNSAVENGAAMLFDVEDATSIYLQDVHFLQNSAGNEGIVVVDNSDGLSEEFLFQVFSKNKLYTENPLEYILMCLWDQVKASNSNFKKTKLVRDTWWRGGNITDNPLSTAPHSIILDTCIFTENVVRAGAVGILGQATLVCRHSIFDSNRYGSVCDGATFTAVLWGHSKISITNTTFTNNSCGALSIGLDDTSYLEIEDSMFFRNRFLDGSGAALSVTTSPDENQLSYTRWGSETYPYYDVLAKNVWFEENVATSDGVLAFVDGRIEIANCTFVNNFARVQGGQIGSYGSTDLRISHSVLRQTIAKVLADNGTEFTASSFFRIYSTGDFVLQNTTIDSNTTADEPLISLSKSKRVNIDNTSLIICPFGSRIEKLLYSYRDRQSKHGIFTVLDFSCEECEYNFYSLQRGFARGIDVDTSFKCMPCPRGADCVPSIKSKTNFWGYTSSLNPPALAFTHCPFGYCKSPTANSSTYNDCHGKRTGVMCGTCSNGYTEALWSTKCTRIKDCDDRLFWVMFLAFVYFMAILLIFNPPFIKFSLNQVLWFKNYTSKRAVNTQGNVYHNFIRSLSQLNEEDREVDLQLSSTEKLKREKRQYSRFLKILFYFYQIAQLLLSSYSLSEFIDSKFLPPVLAFFNFEPSFNQQPLFCPFPGLTPKTKLLFKIIPVFGTLLAVFTIYLVHVFVCKIRGNARPSRSSYLQASIKTIFLGYTTLATVSISLIRCIFVAGETRWFYNGSIACYQWWQYASFLFNAIYVIPFIFVLAWAAFKVHQDRISVRQFLLAVTFPLPFLFVWLFRLLCPGVNVEESQRCNVLKELLLAPYKLPGDGSKNGAIYWQSVLIARRFILVLIFCTVTEPSLRLFCMTIACVLVLSSHLLVKPFRNSLANIFESLSLLLLIVLALINLFKSVFVGSEGNIKGSLVTVFRVFQWLEIVILGLFPFLLSLLLCLAIISLICRLLFIGCMSLFQR